MPRLSLYELAIGNPKIVEYYKNAAEIWKEIIESEYFYVSDLLGQSIENLEMRFRTNCGGKYLGSEIMANMAILQFYDDNIGFDASYEDVLRVLNAVRNSQVSIEVKWFIEKIATLFSLKDDYKPEWEEGV